MYVTPHIEMEIIYLILKLTLALLAGFNQQNATEVMLCQVQAELI